MKKKISSILGATGLAAIIICSMTLNTTKAEASAAAKVNIQALTLGGSASNHGPKSDATGNCLCTNNIGCTQ